MVKLEENSLIITLPHSKPLGALSDLQAGIIAALKYQFDHSDETQGMSNELAYGNIMLLELLEATLKIERK